MQDGRRGSAWPLRSIVLVLAFAAAGCAQMTEFVRQETCSRDAAYAAGVSDGEAGKDRVSNFSWGCPMPDGLNEAYREGYAFGLAHAHHSTAAPHEK